MRQPELVKKSRPHSDKSVANASSFFGKNHSLPENSQLANAIRYSNLRMRYGTFECATGEFAYAAPPSTRYTLNSHFCLNNFHIELSKIKIK